MEVERASDEHEKGSSKDRSHILKKRKRNVFYDRRPAMVAVVQTLANGRHRR